MSQPSAGEIIALLGLRPLPVEGGYYAETYRSSGSLPDGRAGAGPAGARVFGTAIYYFLTPDTFSAFHRLKSDEVYHFYFGDPVELSLLDPNEPGGVRRIVLGSDLLGGARPQAVAPAGIWQGSLLIPGGAYALLGTTMAPGYHSDDFELGEREALTAAFPDAGGVIARLTR